MRVTGGPRGGGGGGVAFYGEYIVRLCRICRLGPSGDRGDMRGEGDGSPGCVGAGEVVRAGRGRDERREAWPRRGGWGQHLPPHPLAGRGECRGGRKLICKEPEKKKR
ncbi:hypothetical protein E2C01_057565 [Portunus trituberculatus]|uniref:Uncharacterized protein n=1 Tax=Portunus trituberculatus TaxID=210409 RepID=A0A5B7H297_PORTR|nr:hypothetical protein [Portunus trituberculatus]